jgi:hypothetical protein
MYVISVCTYVYWSLLPSTLIIGSTVKYLLDSICRQIYLSNSKLLLTHSLTHSKWPLSNISSALHEYEIRPFAFELLSCFINKEFEESYFIYTNTNFIVFGLTRSVLERVMYRSRGEHRCGYVSLKRPTRHVIFWQKF